MRRFLTAREQAALVAGPVQLRQAALPPDVARAHWQSTNETGGEFDSKIRPASHVDVPHPKDLLGPEGYAKWVAKRGGEPQDPVNDPWGRLDDHHNTFDDMVNNKVNHYMAQTKAEALNGRVWYRAFHDGTKAVAQKAERLKNWGKDTHARVVNLFSAFSPKTKWDRNVEFASNFVDKYDGDPAKRHDWKAANIHPMALREYRKRHGAKAVPSDSPEDLHELADLHAGMRGFQDLATPEGRDEWIDNIRSRGGIQNALDRHTDEVVKAHKNTAKKTVLKVRGRAIAATDAYGNILKNRNGPLKSKYIPEAAFTHTNEATPTLGDNIASAKAIHDAEGDDWKTVLGGRKTQSFSMNGADPTPLREARSGVDQDHGYYELPDDDWTRHPDQEVTADTHDVRAIDTPADAGAEHFQDMEYKTPAWFSGSVRGQGAKIKGKDGQVHDLGYELAHRVNWAATKRINEMQTDPKKYVVPKQVQAGVWGRFKNMVTKHAGKAPADGASWWFSLPGYDKLADHFKTLQTPGAGPGVTARRLMTAGLMDGIGHTWGEWLGNWVVRYLGARGEDPDQQYSHEPQLSPIGEQLSPSDQMQDTHIRDVLSFVDRLLG